MPSFNLGIVASSYEVPLPVVSGGTLSSDATYYYRTFTANGNLVISNASLSMDALIWGGGGGGPSSLPDTEGANGGAGGYYNILSGSRAIGTYAIVIGAGGGLSSSGSHSTIFSTNSGFGYEGGIGYTVNSVGTIISAPGNISSFGNGGLGGGGAGGNGQNQTYNGIGTNGGVGLSVWGTTRGKGGNGGEGIYAASRRATADAGVNTSDGGAGGSAYSYSYDPQNFPSRNGGSGIAVVRYLRSAVGG